MTISTATYQYFKRIGGPSANGVVQLEPDGLWILTEDDHYGGVIEPKQALNLAYAILERFEEPIRDRVYQPFWDSLVRGESVLEQAVHAWDHWVPTPLGEPASLEQTLATLVENRATERRELERSFDEMEEQVRAAYAARDAHDMAAASRHIDEAEGAECDWYGECKTIGRLAEQWRERDSK